MEESSLKELVHKEIDAAKERLDAAELLFNDGKLVDAVNRAYYSTYHAGKALLHSIGRDAKTHAGLISEIGFHLVEKGMMEKTYGTILRRLFESRETSDYVVGAVFTEEEVNEMLKGAKSFLQMAAKKTEENLKKYLK
jgi:uncharacterized protein (UPF0332 family)